MEICIYSGNVVQYNPLIHGFHSPGRTCGIHRNGRIRGIFEPPQYHLKKVILGLEKYLKDLEND